MRAVLNNPYRIAGLLVGATTREQDKQIKRLKQYLEADHEPPQDDYSFPILGKVNRTPETVEYAASRLHLDSDKLNAALFWFYNGNPITDEPALDALKDSDISTAIDVWSKMTASGKVTKKNCSAFQNLSTFFLWLNVCVELLTLAQFKSRIGAVRLHMIVSPNDKRGFLKDDAGNTVAVLSERIRQKGDIVKPVLVYNRFAKTWTMVNWSSKDSFVDLSKTALEQGIRMKLQFLESDFVRDLQLKATDATYKTTKQAIQSVFLNTLQQELEQSGKITPIQWIEMLSKYEFSAKEEYLSNFIQKPIEQIERKIETAEAKRKANQANAAYVGNEFYASVENGVKQIQSVSGINRIGFSSLVNKVAEEILQCGIDYFVYYRDTATDPSGVSMDLYRKAYNLAAGSIAKQKCQENIDNLQKWIDDRQARDKKKKVENDLQFIVDKIKYLQNLPETVYNAKNLIDSCKSKLQTIKNTLGETDNLYLEISSAVVSRAQEMVVTVVNKAQTEFGVKTVSFSELSAIVNSAYEVTASMLSMDMTNNLKQQFQKNTDTLTGLRNQINSSPEQNSYDSMPDNSFNTKPNNFLGNKACYIATMAYGDYNHPQVLVLRQFRDEILDKSVLGRWFIKTYYHYSPKLVEHLKDKKTIAGIIRSLLNQVIKIIK